MPSVNRSQSGLGKDSRQHIGMVGGDSEHCWILDRRAPHSFLRRHRVKDPVQKGGSQPQNWFTIYMGRYQGVAPSTHLSKAVISSTVSAGFGFQSVLFSVHCQLAQAGDLEAQMVRPSSGLVCFPDPLLALWQSLSSVVFFFSTPDLKKSIFSCFIRQ